MSDIPWFKVDDGFWSHPKTLQLSDGAQALWMRAGSWSMHQLTDGFIPDFALPILSAKPRYVNELRRVSLWLVVKDGNQFHDWEKYQPTREQVEQDRRDAAERKRKSRERSQRPSQVTKPGVTPDDTPTPTRPDPTRPTSKEKTPVHPSAELVKEFSEFWSVYPRKQGKAAGEKAYFKARKTTAAKVIFAGAQAYALLNIGKEKEFLKMPAGWLNDKRWADEQIVNATKRTVTDQPRECDVHPGYPLPCDKCEREGRPF